MDKIKLARYAALKATEKQVKVEIAELGLELKAMITEAGADKLDVNGIGTFTLKPVPVWEYSPAVEDAEKKVDELKAKEKAEGIAKATTRTDLVFTVPKATKIDE